MRCRPIDKTGDMLPCSSRNALLRDAEAVMQAVRSRLNLFRGEWWEDPEIGFSVPSLLLESTRMSSSTSMLAGYITAYIAQTPGVVSVDASSVFTDGHSMFYSCRVLTAYDSTIREVSTDVIL